MLSLKGGVGKTTVALGLASAAVHRGVRTVLVDLDPQANASATLAPGHDPSLPPGRRTRHSGSGSRRAAAAAASGVGSASGVRTASGVRSASGGGTASGVGAAADSGAATDAGPGTDAERSSDTEPFADTEPFSDTDGPGVGTDATAGDTAGSGAGPGPSQESALATVADVLGAPKRGVIADALLATSWGPSLQLLAGSEHVEAHNHPDPGSKRLSRLATALGKLPGDPELVLIDCPPSLGQLTRSALVASDRAVLVTEPSLYAVTGVQRALEAVQAERAAHRPTLQPLGVVINRVRPRSTEHDYRMAELRDMFGPLVLRPVLPDRSAVQQAQGAAVPIHEWPTPGAREIAGMFDALLDRLLRSGKRR